MIPTEADFRELRTLADAAIDGRLTEVQLARLEELVLSHPDCRRHYADYLGLNASLQWATGSPVPWATPAVPPVLRPRRWLVRHWGSVALCLVCGLLIQVVWLTTRTAVPLAVLTDTKACKWDGGTLPTEVGTKLHAGRLRLSEGLAHIVFASGTEVTLEGPADIELVSAMRCVLHRGKLIAKVPPQAIGFVVDTPTSVVTDYGTEFGVTVHDGKTADVQVFNGHIDVLHRSTGATETMKTGVGRRFTSDAIEPYNPNVDSQDDGGLMKSPVQVGTRIVPISTAQGRGRDAFVMPIAIPENRRSEALLLIKNTTPKMADWNRKAYMGIDLSSVQGLPIQDAAFSLTFAPTGMGFASQLPDSVFTLYGLTDETLDDWDEATLRWQNAPANRPGGTNLDATKVTALGSFEIAQGEQTGTRTVTGPALVDFLRRDTNKLVTFILVRETCGSGNGDLVHGFASKRHPTLVPPTLRLTVGNTRP